MDELQNIPEMQHAVAMLEKMAKDGFGLPEIDPAQIVSSRPEPVEPAEAPGQSNIWKPDLRYRSLVEKLPVVTFMASLDERLQELYISPQIEALLGFTQEEWLDNPILWYRQLHPDDRERWVAEFSRTCSTGAHFRAEYRLFTRDGRIVWVQGECQLIRDEDGRPVFLQGIAFDITHLKNVAVVEEAKRAAEAASSAKSEFLARMSHEIRTPLNGVVGMIDLLRSTEMTEVQQRYAQLARESANALLEVINDILDFSKIEAGKVEVEAIEFDLYKVVEDLTELLAPMAGKKNLSLASFFRPEVPQVGIGDPNRIRQVLTNLINNALKFTGHGHVHIRVSLESQDDSGLVVRVMVEDSGIGIATEGLARLFKSFSQVDSSTTRKFGGTGLGLAISKRLVELMGGEIGVDSVVGRGTTFWFTLKLGAASSEAVARVAGPAQALHNVRVLAVEADPSHREILAEQLEGRWSPMSAITPVEEALKILSEAAEAGKPYTIVLISHGSPASTLLNSAIRRDSALKQTKIIAVLNMNDPADDDMMREAGYCARLHRPLTQSRLVDTISSVALGSGENDLSSDFETTTSIDALKGLHLLVADDNEMNQFVTQETLRRVECTCDIVGDGLAAVDAARTKNYDAILMDCEMPRMGGLEATRRIREIEAEMTGSRHIPIIALTAEAIQGDREKCLAAGMDGYVTKPIDVDKLFETIRELVPAKPAASIPYAGRNLPSPIDLEELLGRCLKDAEFACQTLEKFKKRAADDVELLRRGLAKGDSETIRQLAHNLKAVAAHVGAKSMRQFAYEIEQAGARCDLQIIEQQLIPLAEEAKRCAGYIPLAIEELKKAAVAAKPSSK